LSTGKTLLEVICSSAGDCVRAQEGGADRIELCAALELGGLTPSIGTFEECLARTRLPIMVMVRPRTGGFDYTESEFAAMLRDVDAFRRSGANGIVFGILDRDRRIDLARASLLVEQAQGIQTVFHRAFDAAADPFAAIDDLIELRLTRILTSGQRSTALLGSELIRQLVERAGGRIEVLAGGSLRAENLRDFVRTTGVLQVHVSAFEDEPDLSMDGVKVAFNGRPAREAAFRTVSSQLVRALKASL
jgi:copper homeostasis protein